MDIVYWKNLEKVQVQSETVEMDLVVSYAFWRVPEVENCIWVKIHLTQLDSHMCCEQALSASVFMSRPGVPPKVTKR